jgi:hypothetical protein
MNNNKKNMDKSKEKINWMVALKLLRGRCENWWG